MGLRAAVREDLDGIVAILTLGVGLLGLFLGVENWWIAFVIGWVVLTPLAGMLTDGDDEMASAALEGRLEEKLGADEHGDHGETTQDALDTLRDRYARGDLSEAEFERKVERLLETETPERAREYAVGEDPEAERDRER